MHVLKNTQLLILTISAKWIPGFPSIINSSLLSSKYFQYLQCLDKPLGKGFFHGESQTMYFGKQHFKDWYNAVRNYVGRQKSLMFSATEIQSASKKCAKTYWEAPVASFPGENTNTIKNTSISTESSSYFKYLEHLSYEHRVRELGFFNLEKAPGRPHST